MLVLSLQLAGLGMLNDQQLRDWCGRVGLHQNAEQVIRQVRSSDPARRVQGRRGNVRGCFPSRKMGHTIQYESLTNELSAIYLMEYHEEDLWEYWEWWLGIFFLLNGLKL